MGLLKEFKEFAMRGNVVDMAVGVVIGASFGKIVTSLVNDMIMPPIGRLVGNMDFSQLTVKLGEATKTVTEGGATKEVTEQIVLRYGAFLNTVVDFVIVAFCLFIVIKGMNTLKRLQEGKKQEEAAAAPPEPPADVKLLTEIRDLLKSSRG
jgi:large conductance mechanosensitive channel